MPIYTEETLVSALQRLQKKGYTTDFKFEKEEMKSLSDGTKYAPEDMKIAETRRFEGMSNPDDMSILFAVTCKDGTKGTIVSSYGPNADLKLDTFMEKVESVDKT